MTKEKSDECDYARKLSGHFLAVPSYFCITLFGSMTDEYDPFTGFPACSSSNR